MAVKATHARAAKLARNPADSRALPLNTLTRGAQEYEMPTQSEIEAAARVLCRLAYFQLPPNERMCSADLWPDVDVPIVQHLQNSPHKRWETFNHEARVALEAAEYVRDKKR
jgi:hypothetical protein